MRRSLWPAAVTVGLLWPAPARADGPDPAVAIAAGAASVFGGFVVGGTLAATQRGSASGTEAGWFAIESGFTVAPLVAHGLVNEWVRGAVFAAVPTATTLATVPVFVATPASVEHGTLTQQRIMWGLFCGGLAASMAGVIDTAFAPARALQVAPILGNGSAGLVIGGTL